MHALQEAPVNGRYKLIRSLGEGGMGTVFLAADLALESRPVALKRLHASSVRSGAEASFKTEFEAMTRLRHPNVVEVYDFGVDQASGELFLTLEHVEGADLRSAVRGSSQDEIVDLLVQVCRGLEYIHSRGLLHNDLKPQNILVTAGTPPVCKLVDFGLSSSTGSTGAPSAGLRGTLHYLAPELVHGARPDRRSDIYSLGVVFYLALTGRLPFEGEPADVLTKVTGQEPAAPRSLNPALGEGLQALVLRMLSKDPAARPASAAAAILSLSEATCREYPVDTPATLASYARTGSFVGRRKEMDRLMRAFEAAAGPTDSPAKRLALLSGEGGIGKSRLIRQLRYQVQLRGAQFASGQCYEGSASAFHPFLQALPLVAPGALQDETLAALLQPASQAGEATGDDPVRPRPDPEIARRNALDAVAQSVLLAASRSGPLVLCVEDAQWADTASLALLEHLARNAGAAPRLALLVTYRSEDADAPPLSVALPRLGRAADWERVELARLDRAEIEQMLSGMLGIERPAPGLVDLLVRETEGNPFFMQVAVESLLEEQALARPDADWASADLEGLARIPFPKSVADALSRRVSRLEPLEASVLEALAVVERPMDPQLLQHVLPAPPGGGAVGLVTAAVDGLARRRLVAREVDDSGAIRIRIDHVKIRDHVYESMDWSRRSDLHARVGVALESCGDFGIEEIAAHFVRSADAGRALSYAERAGRHALALFASERAISFFESALELVPPADATRRLRLQLDLADAYNLAREFGRAAEIYERVIKGARAAGQKATAWSATVSMMDVQRRAGQLEEVEQTGRKILASLRAEGETIELIRCLTLLGVVAGNRGQLEEAQRIAEEALALSRAAGDVGGMASNLNNLANIDLMGEPTEKGLAMLEESFELRRRQGDEPRCASVVVNIGLWHRRRGHLALAAARLEEATQMARRARDRWLLVQCGANLASIYHAQGKLDVAAALARRAAADARGIGHEEYECEALDYLGMIQRDLGDPAAAAATHEQAAALARGAGLAGQEAYALASLTLDRVATPEGASRETRSLRDTLRKAEKLASTVRSHRLQARLHEAAARIALAAGEADKALHSAKRALEEATAGRLADSQGAAHLVVSDALLAGSGSDRGALSAEAARQAASIAGANGLAEYVWRAHARLAEQAQADGQRSLERQELGRAASAIEQAAGGIADDQVRLAYLAEPRRAEILRRAATIAPRWSGVGESSTEGALAAIYEVAEILSSIHDLDSLLERILDVALGIVGAERGLIILLDPATGEQQVAAARDLEEETVRDALAYSHSVVREAAAGRVIVALDAPQDSRFKGFKSVSLYAIKSLMCVPMKMRERILGTVYVDNRRQGVPFNEKDLRFLEALASLAASAVEQARMQERLAAENVYLRREAGERNRYQNIIGKNVKMQAVYDLIEKVSASGLPVLIQGESGTGKELVARALHYSGPRRGRKFLSENVAAIPDTLLESEMFGHVRGAFTGADRDRKGVFELADGGTLFLDEIGDMSLPMQSKLLRALQEGEIRPVGGKDVRKVDVRVISATNKDLEHLMKDGRFREDLYYRLNVIRIPLPPLRERKEDIPLLVDNVLTKVSREAGGTSKRMELGALQLLLRYSWPGNVRELENEVQRLAVLSPGEIITQRDVMESGELYDRITRLEEHEGFTPLEEVERRQIEKALMEAAGNRGRAAELLGISRATIFRKIRKFSISH